MSSGNVDLDRLADFVGGALDGTADADAVRHLVETDPYWRRAHADLVGAMPAVRLDLARLRDFDVVMPADVVARLDQALASPVRENNVIKLDERRRRRHRLMVVSGVAAAVVACGVVGVGALQNLRPHVANDATTAANRGDEQRSTSDQGGGAPNAPGAAGVAPGSVIASGRDYSSSSIGALSSPAPAFSLNQPPTEREAPSITGKAPAELGRLFDSRLRAQCLNAIVREYGGTVSVVDFARYEGLPALVVALTGTRIAPTGRLVVVVGPTCGENDAIADQRFLTQI